MILIKKNIIIIQLDDINIPIIYTNKIDYDNIYQFEKYKNLDYLNIIPFIKKYYSPNQDIINIKN